MRGLKKQEDAGFERFFELVQQEAAKRGAVFFAYAGDGNDIVTPEFEGEELMGWLIPSDKADEFEAVWKTAKSDNDLKDCNDFFLWEEWSESDGALSIDFVKYDS